MDLVFASLASLLAGAIDSIVGGGGLILVPALFAIYPSAPPAIVNSVRRRPCSAPCVSASKPLGPGDSDRPRAAAK